MVSATQASGYTKEAQAILFLENQGLRLIEQHAQCRYGEIDLIMQDKQCLVFVEVRLRSNKHYGSGIESVTRAKQKKLIKTAQHYLQNHIQWQQYACRFDIVAYRAMADIDPLWLQHAFDATE